MNNKVLLMETLTYGYSLAEAPRVDAEGNLYFSDAIGGGVYRRTPNGELTTVVPKRRGVGGLLFHAQGGIVVSGRDVCHVRDGVTRTLLAPPAGFAGFNDITADRQGRVLAGALQNMFEIPEEQMAGELLRVDTEGRFTRMCPDLRWPNGLGFSPDGTVLYHSDYGASEVIALDIDSDGNANGRRSFVRLPEGSPDGLAIDIEGGVWVAVIRGGCVARFLPDGTLDRSIPVPARMVASLCFGGADMRDLYICTADNTEQPERRGTIFRTRSDVPGLPVPMVTI